MVFSMCDTFHTQLGDLFNVIRTRDEISKKKTPLSVRVRRRVLCSVYGSDEKPRKRRKNFRKKGSFKNF